MKNILAIFISAACIAVFTVSGNAEQLSFSRAADTQALNASDEPLATVLPISPDGSLEAYSGTGLAPFIPMQFDQFVISLLDVSPGDDADVQTSFLPRFQLNTGIKTESSLANPKTLLMDELLGSDSDSPEFGPSVIFVGVGFDFKSLYLKGNAFIGRPLDTIPNKLSNAQSPERVNQKSVDKDAYGYEASAGYQLSNMIALGAGFGKITEKNKETDQPEEVYAVYAQAILAVAPGVNVKPEVGKVDRIKEESNAEEEIDKSFYAGAIWEIKF